MAKQKFSRLGKLIKQGKVLSKTAKAKLKKQGFLKKGGGPSMRGTGALSRRLSGVGEG